MGKSDMDGYQRMYSLSLSLTIIVDLIFLALCFLCTDALVNICGGSKAAAEAVVFGKLYVRTACPMILFFCVGTLFQIVLTTYGYQTDQMICSVVNVGVNIGVSITAVLLLPEEYKIAGLGIGSAAGAFLQMVIQRISLDITYSYSYHLNVVSLTVNA